jgi:hypothetical protein
MGEEIVTLMARNVDANSSLRRKSKSEPLREKVTYGKDNT